MCDPSHCSFNETVKRSPAWAQIKPAGASAGAGQLRAAPAFASHPPHLRCTAFELRLPGTHLEPTRPPETELP